MTTKKTTKKAFILSLPSDMRAEEVVAKGAEQGIKLSENQVHATRSQARVAARNKRKKAKTIRRAGIEIDVPKSFLKPLAKTAPIRIVSRTEGSGASSTDLAARQLVIALDVFIRAHVRQAILKSLRSEFGHDEEG
jgi:hypothetical protein